MPKTTMVLLFTLGAGATAATAGPVDHGVPPETLFVDDDAGPGGDGATWETAMAHLSDALALAQWTGVIEIRVAQGRYLPDRSAALPFGTGERASTFAVPSGLALRGGYAGIGAVDPDARDAATFRVTLSGDLEGDDDQPSDNAYHVVTIRDGNVDTLVEGFYITGGVGDAGGGVLVSGGTPTVRACVLEENVGIHGGGLALLDGTTASVHGCIVRANQGLLSAGGGIVRASEPVIESCVFDHNTSLGGGGLVIEDGANVILRDSVFAHNRSSHVWVYADGGAILARAPAVVEGCVFTENVSTTRGGALFNAGTLVSVRNCSMVGNSASTGGAVHTVDPGMTTATDTFLCGNLPRDTEGPFDGDGTNEFCCEQDMDGDGFVGMADLLSMLHGWGLCEECAQDLDGDGMVDAADLLILLSAWGACDL